ncbi:hypothetical protein QCA50_004710 [Cerrena zonata]|uniref:Complex 1 LYR protein n=1 Tax=Cerrena zonata TaxID=2478898 RepID=A0AAW0GEW4_9APHY
MTTPGVALPPAFSSLYRLFIRNTATAVLDDARSTKVLRMLYRPSFREAAVVIRRLQISDELPGHERRALQVWLSNWQDRVDNTLSFLSNSSLRRGIPHKVTRNLGKVVRSLEQSERVGPVKKIGRTWDPKDPYSVRERLTALTPDHSVTRQRLFQDEAIGTMVEAIRMAEGRNGVHLGRISTKLPL